MNPVRCQSNHRGRASSVKFHFFADSVPFCSVPSFGIGSSAELGMPRNEHFLPQNNGNRSESIPRNFSDRNSVSNPTSKLGRDVPPTSPLKDSLSCQARDFLLTSSLPNYHEQSPPFPIYTNPPHDLISLSIVYRMLFY